MQLEKYIWASLLHIKSQIKANIVPKHITIRLIIACPIDPLRIKNLNMLLIMKNPKIIISQTKINIPNKRKYFIMFKSQE